MRRTLLGMSQEKLGDAIGLTFQQVQKYERGSNRISAGTLFRLGQVLDVPVSFFFDSYDDPHATTRPARGADSSIPADGVISRREARLLRLWRAAPSPVADEMLALLACLSPHIGDLGGDLGSDSAGDLAGAASSAGGDGARGMGGALAGMAATMTEEKARPAPSVRKVKAASGDGLGKSRRRHGAIWDPSDIYKATKAPTRG